MDKNRYVATLIGYFGLPDHRPLQNQSQRIAEIGDKSIRASRNACSECLGQLNEAYFRSLTDANDAVADANVDLRMAIVAAGQDPDNEALQQQVVLAGLRVASAEIDAAIAERDKGVSDDHLGCG